MRKPQVTRTMKATLVTFKAVDKTNDVMFDFDMLLPRYYKDEKALIKAGQEELAKTDVILLRVLEQHHNIYKVIQSESEFFRNGRKVQINIEKE